MTTTLLEPMQIDPGLLRSLLTEDVYRPVEPTTLAETGLSEALIEALLCKQLAQCGSATGRSLAKEVCLPFAVVAAVLDQLRSRKVVTHGGTARFNDFLYVLTEKGQTRAQELTRECAYVGPAPVRLAEYILSVEAQSISHEAPDR